MPKSIKNRSEFYLDTSFITHNKINLNTFLQKSLSYVDFGTPIPSLNFYAGFIDGAHSKLNIKTTNANSHNLFFVFGELNVSGGGSISCGAGINAYNLVNNNLSYSGDNLFVLSAIPWSQFIIVSSGELEITLE